ncbi:MAG: SDR family NAD(P)-dependent oxidoreductase [Sphingobium sp.]
MTGRVALVSGGGRGIGAAIALGLAARGCDVAINYRRDTEAAEKTAQAVRDLGGRAALVPGSIADPAACAQIVASAVEQLGGIDILINNAGIASSGRSLADTPIEEMHRLMDTHCMGAFALTQAALPHLRAARPGHVLFISSTATATLSAGTGPYTMAKAAIEAMSVVWAKELCRENIFMNVLGPSLTATEMGFRLARAFTGVNAIEQLDSQMPFGHVCRPEEVAEAAIFLVSPANSYVSGQRVYVNGGVPEVDLSAPA